MFGESLKHLGETASTNDDARVWARDGATHGSVVRADSQTRGRGRLGRSWVSPPDLGLYFSLILRPEIPMAHVSQLTFLAALACVDAIQETTGLRADVKWPNDLVLHEKKIGGILCEAANTAPANIASANMAPLNVAPASIEYSNRVDFVVVGIGLNLNFCADDLPHDAKLPASSLNLESGNFQDGDALFKSLMWALQGRYERWKNGGWDDLRRDFAQKDILQNRLVRVQTETEIFRGRVRGIDTDGVLLVRSETGLRRVVAGDVKLEE